MRQLPRGRQFTLCTTALAESHRGVQLAAMHTLLDVNGLDRPDVVVNGYSDLLPAVRRAACKHRDTLMREARTQLSTGNDRQRVRGCRVITDMGGPGAAGTLVKHLTDELEDVRNLIAAELMTQFRSLVEARRSSLAGEEHALIRDGWEPGLWSAYEAVLTTLQQHGRTEFLDLLPEFGAAVLPALAKALAADDDGSLRTAVAKLLEQSIQPSAVELVLALSAHAASAVQRVGQQVLAARKDDAYALAVGEVVANRGDVVARTPWPAAVLAVTSHVEASNAKQLLTLLAEDSDDSTTTACVEAFLEHPDDGVRLAAAGLVIEWALPNRASLLAPLVGSDCVELRQLAVREVSKVSFELYMHRFEGMSPQTRQAAARAVAKIDDTILDKLADGIRSLDAKNRFKALQIVGFLDAGEDLRASLMSLLADPDRHVRATALRIVELTGSVPGMKALIDALSDPDRRVRANAIETFEGLDDDCYLDIFVPFLTDRDNRVRANAVKALWNVGYDGARDSLIAMLHDEDEAMRLSAVWTLSELRCDGADELLDARALCETSPTVLTKIAEAKLMLTAPGELA